MQNTGIQTRTIGELEQIHICGRTTMTEGTVNLFWSGSGLDFCFDGTELSIRCEADYERFEPWLSILVDGSWVMRLPLQKGISSISVLRGMMPGCRHRIQILKDVQAMADDPFHRISIYSISFTGEIVSPPDFNMRIELIGDSITSGEGCIGAQRETDWVPAFFSVVPTYGRRLAEMLNADFRILSQSGWGVYTAWDNNIYCNLPSCYEFVCSLSGDTSRDGKALGTHERNDFSKWSADVIVINLGTNDESSFHNPAYSDPITGKTFQNRLFLDGEYYSDDVQKIIKAQKTFLQKIRECNPQSIIIWCYGMLGNKFSKYLKEGVQQFCEEQIDDRTFYLELPTMTLEMAGSRMHPGEQCHQKVTEMLVKYIRRLLENMR